MGPSRLPVENAWRAPPTVTVAVEPFLHEPAGLVIAYFYSNEVTEATCQPEHNKRFEGS
jgi:hypothetical protein